MSNLFSIQAICGLLARGDIDRGEFFVELTRGIAVEIGCHRAGVRLFIDTARGTVLRSAAMYDATREQVIRAPDLKVAKGSPYVDSLTRGGCVAIPDTRAHPFATQLVDYVEATNVRSMLDACLSLNGVLHGTFSCEQTESAMDWSARQLRVLRQIASRASLSVVQAIGDQRDTAPAPLWQFSERDHLVTLPMPLDSDQQKD